MYQLLAGGSVVKNLLECIKMKDKNGVEFELGDILDSDDGYSVVVVEWEGIDHWVGKLICDENDSCRDVLYDLNDGDGYTKRI